MTRTVVALYDNMNDANAAIREMVDNGFNKEDISLMAGDEAGKYSQSVGSTTNQPRSVEPTTSGASEGAGVGASVGAALGGIGGLLVGLGALVIPGVGPVIAAGPLAAALAGLAGAGAGALAGGVTGGLIGALVDVGVPEETARYYQEGIRRGGLLVTVRTDDTMSGKAVNIMNRHNPVDINTRASDWRSQGWTGTTEPREISRSQDMGNTPRDTVESDRTRREQQYGVEQNIPATGDRDTTFGASGQNRQVGDMRGEDMTTRGTTGQDFQSTGPQGEMRPSGTDYNSTRMDNYGSEMQREYRQFDYYDTDFHNHFNRTFGTTYAYDQYQPVYRYGYDLATDPRYSSRNWEDIEPEARRYWDERQPGVWDRIKDAVRYAWDEVRS